ncbi:uncharacterized protein LACBIDRAFT_330331 [Laccaria bicolor S238N-H82]|uniref:Predicted protein n=1 Tax=Laccaria bicolor (strain S238N-H82 / ATCC MYA-4686) TaxID=486041 RepID=B0DKY5_LACBS|nr:uncharacterized protein LACBIDRAFT_330331 [Laccaria bicolor S238N-H82]EDR04819.1 predicted protein [Laccaria bicolor S238N-H82]|eukprot:XP_001884643.1 predicted protein [Laccaria bicolor S238N-H82]
MVKEVHPSMADENTDSKNSAAALLRVTKLVRSRDSSYSLAVSTNMPSSHPSDNWPSSKFESSAASCSLTEGARLFSLDAIGSMVGLPLCWRRGITCLPPSSAPKGAHDHDLLLEQPCAFYNPNDNCLWAIVVILRPTGSDLPLTLSLFVSFRLCLPTRASEPLHPPIQELYALSDALPPLPHFSTTKRQLSATNEALPPLWHSITHLQLTKNRAQTEHDEGWIRSGREVHACANLLGSIFSHQDYCEEFQLGGRINASFQLPKNDLGCIDHSGLQIGSSGALPS